MKRILVDMDGVLADIYQRFFELHEEETDIRKTFNEIIGMKEGDAFPALGDWVMTPGFFRSMPVMPGSQKGLKLLNEKYDVTVVSMQRNFR